LHAYLNPLLQIAQIPNAASVTAATRFSTAPRNAMKVDSQAEVILRIAHQSIDPRKTPTTKYAGASAPTLATIAAKERIVETMDEILECHHVTGEESFIRCAVDAISSLETLIQKLTEYGPTTTSVILSTSLDRRHFVPIQK
jgi:hypothetical protein